MNNDTRILSSKLQVKSCHERNQLPQCDEQMNGKSTR